ncbi:MAG: TonB-dependent receptor [Gluconobacter cerinus]|uniref:TonB-dependent receptor domain-containing protein n=1 Tax=Gluconobacter TaxID=441 RepID=UPI0039E96D2E
MNGAAFYYDYHGQQLAAPIVLTGYGTIGKFVNIPRSEIWGIEGTLEVHPFRHLVVLQNFGYERGNYRVFQSTNLPAVNAAYNKTGIWAPIYTNYAGNDMGLPKLTLNGTANYTLAPLQHYQWETGLDWQYRGSQAVSVGGFGSYGYYLPAYFLLGAHMTFRPSNDRWSVSVYGSNLLDRHYYPSAGAVTVSQYWIPGAPRFVGGRFGVRF